MKKKTFQQPERYEAPKVKVKNFRRRSVICASVGNETVGQDEQVDPFGE